MRLARQTIALFLVVGLVVLSGCYRHHIIVNDSVPTQGYARANITTAFVLGLVPLRDPIPLNLLCPNGIGLIYQRQGLLSLVMSVLSSSIVMARSALIYCSAAPPYADSGPAPGSSPAGPPRQGVGAVAPPTPDQADP